MELNWYYSKISFHSPEKIIAVFASPFWYGGLLVVVVGFRFGMNSGVLEITRLGLPSVSAIALENDGGGGDFNKLSRENQTHVNHGVRMVV